MNCGWHAWVQNLLTDVVLFHRTTWVGATLVRLLGGVKHPGRVTWCGVDRPGLWLTISLMENPTFTRACLSSARVIGVIIHVPVVELLCQTTMGRLLVHKYLLSGTCGCLLPCHIMTSIKCCLFLRTRLRGWLWWPWFDILLNFPLWPLKSSKFHT
jgi:hypothetical protein